MKKIILLLFILGFSCHIFAQNKSVYELLEKGTLISIAQKLEELEPSINTVNIDATYYGALISKQSQLLKRPKQKLKKFKLGISYIEKSIIKEPRNPELRFLRYIIQVNSPKFLKYRKNIEDDKNMIEKSNINAKLNQMITNFNAKNQAHLIVIK